MLDITLVSCNYNTPQLIETMLKSWVVHNHDVTNKCLIMEHSTDDDTIPFLKENGIPYVRNRGAVHYKGVEAAFHLVNTRYMLLVDSDVVFTLPAHDILKEYIRGEIQLAGKVEGDRGGFLLHKRVHPWFCFIDLDFVNKHSIRFADMNRINSTRSEGFYKNNPITEFHHVRKYDVGATFLEDIMRFKGRVFNHDIENRCFVHYEGMSWRKSTGIPSLIEANNENEKKYISEIDKYSGTVLKGFFDDR